MVLATARPEMIRWAIGGASDGLASGDLTHAAGLSLEKPTQTNENLLPANPEVVDLTALPGVECPCGIARRAFADREEVPGTVHLTEIDRDAREHFHKEHTEVYVILECEQGAAIELDGERHSVEPKTAILIPPGVRHRACGQMKVLILCTPNFDPADEHF